MRPRRRSDSSRTRNWKANRFWPVGWERTRWRRERTFSMRPTCPTFKYPDRAAQAFCYMWKYTRKPARPLRNTVAGGRSGGRGRARPRRRHVEGVRNQGRTILTEFESKQLLAAHGIPTVETTSPRREAEAVESPRSWVFRSCSSFTRKPSPTRPTLAECS